MEEGEGRGEGGEGGRGREGEGGREGGGEGGEGGREGKEGGREEGRKEKTGCVTTSSLPSNPLQVSSMQEPICQWESNRETQ